jgi:hypothetical protein
MLTKQPILEQKFELEIEKVVVEAVEAHPAVVETVKYDRDFIEKQIVDITAQRDEFIRQIQEQLDLKQKELDECLGILAEMDKQNVVSKEAFITNLKVNE